MDFVTLVIVESPAKCKKIESYLGSNYKCVATFGHLTELKSKKDIDVLNNFKATYRVIPAKKQYHDKLLSAVRSAGTVILATDDDREGEAIAWHVCQLCNLPVATTRRIIFNEITKIAILHAVQNPVTINMDLVRAQQARQILDLMVGFTISPVLWKNIFHNAKNGLSAGRCQTPALKIIYDNEKDILSSPGKLMYMTTGYFTKLNLAFALSHTFEQNNDVEKFLELSVDHKHIFDCSEPKRTTKSSPRPFSTSTLQQSAQTTLGYSPKETMTICQKLYEEGHITYMRTDTKLYSGEFIEKAKKYIMQNWNDEYIGEDIERLTIGQETKHKTAKDKERMVQEAHEAIRPTNIGTSYLDDSYSAKEKKIYMLIWRNTCESCMSTCTTNSIVTVITAPQGHMYTYTSEQVIFPGWKVIGGFDEANPVYSFLRALKPNVIISHNKIISKQSLKETKSHYTEARLVHALEEKGIGRPSTFASLIEKIQERGYVQRKDVSGKTMICKDFELEDGEITETEEEKMFGNEKKKLVIAPIGHAVCEFLYKHFNDLFEYGYTRSMEEKLDLIASGALVWHGICKECTDEISRLEARIGGDDRVIIPTDERTLGNYEGQELLLKKGKYGLYIKWGDKTASVKGLTKKEIDIDINDVIPFIETAAQNKSILRVVTPELSIRAGQYGTYGFYKTAQMKKPRFLKLAKFPENICTCKEEVILGWMKSTYNIG